MCPVAVRIPIRAHAVRTGSELVHGAELELAQRGSAATRRPTRAASASAPAYVADRRRRSKRKSRAACGDQRTSPRRTEAARNLLGRRAGFGSCALTRAPSFRQSDRSRSGSVCSMWIGKRGRYTRTYWALRWFRRRALRQPCLPRPRVLRRPIPTPRRHEHAEPAYPKLNSRSVSVKLSHRR
jgi:hypothetical protein